MLPIRSGPKLPDDPAFKHPPQWIHEAGKWLFFQRESRKVEKGVRTLFPVSYAQRREKGS